MASQQILFSPAELAYLHRSLSLKPPIRPDGRSPAQFRPLTAETGILPGTNGSARVHFSDGTEAIVGVKAEIEKTVEAPRAEEPDRSRPESKEAESARTRGDWLELAVEIPGQRDDEASTVFLAEMLREALLADKEFAKKLFINRRFHWRLYLDVCLMSTPMFNCTSFKKTMLTGFSTRRFFSSPRRYPTPSPSSPSPPTSPS